MANPLKYHLLPVELNSHREVEGQEEAEEEEEGEEEVSEVVAVDPALTLREETGPAPTVPAAT